jgi:hypothetical protein
MSLIPAWLTGCGFTARLEHRKAASAISIKGTNWREGGFQPWAWGPKNPIACRVYKVLIRRRDGHHGMVVLAQ